MYKIVFSVPVHENPEVVFDLILNYKYFNPDCAIVLHLARNFNYTNSRYNEQKFLKKLEELKDVYVNPEHVRTGFGDIIQAHISNFEYINKIAEFEYISLGASNDLFIKKGLYDFINNWKAGLKIYSIDEDKTWMAAYKARRDMELKYMIQEVGGNIEKIYRSQVEGAFFQKNVFSKLSSIINQYYDYKAVPLDKLYAREEVYFSTLINYIIPKNNIYFDNITYNAEESATWTVYKKDIDNLIKNKVPYYCVKRIERELNNPIRSYIREQVGDYRQSLLQLCENAEKYDELKLNSFESEKRKIDKRKEGVEKLKNFVKLIKPVRDIIGYYKKKA